MGDDLQPYVHNYVRSVCFPEARVETCCLIITSPSASNISIRLSFHTEYVASKMVFDSS